MERPLNHESSAPARLATRTRLLVANHAPTKRRGWRARRSATVSFRHRRRWHGRGSTVKSATGIRNTVVWTKLYKFQRDGVVGSLDKLERFGGCIIADSVGLGKTFEALAIIKYHELRHDRVHVLCPKHLRDQPDQQSTAAGTTATY